MTVAVVDTSAACSICSHSDQQAIDRALALREVTQAKVSRELKISRTSVHRHFHNHLLPMLGDLLRRHRDAEGLDILSELQGLYVDLRERYDAIDDRGLVPSYHGQLRKDLELLARITGELESAKLQIDITQTQQFIEVNQVILDSLQPFPEARLAVAAALKVDQ
ncbi:MAG: hypothetical protein IH953_02780 [Chloroflexi bacterium]|nr:hypothetical protein [Chloroflexota bacterium]